MVVFDDKQACLRRRKSSEKINIEKPLSIYPWFSSVMTTNKIRLQIGRPGVLQLGGLQFTVRDEKVEAGLHKGSSTL